RLAGGSRVAMRTPGARDAPREPPGRLAGVTGMGPDSDAALGDYYPLAYRRLLGTLRVMGVPAADAAEVAQEAFVRLIPKWDRVRSYESPDGWLRTVAWRIWLNRRRKDHRTDTVAEVPDPTGRTADRTARQSEVAVEDRLALMTALGELPDGHREVVVLHYLADLPLASIAVDLGVAEGTAKSRLSRPR